MPVLYDPADGSVCTNHLPVGAEPRPSPYEESANERSEELKVVKT
jgi:hypothetical protein